uniref:Si:dkeyp-23e4.3 n=2 Tax=Takifugu rubripes TaxID=31033 RepID=H2RLS7_TAKRU
MLITKIEAKEACDWLRAAGFPQYAQLFKDCGFPIDVDWAKRDHSFLDKDALDSLCRRLSTLNKCMEMRLEPRRSKRRGNENEEDFCAISPSWTFDRRTRRWRRCGSMVEAPSPADSPGGPGDASLCDHHDICSINSSSSSESEGQSFRENASSSTSATATTSTTDDHETSGSTSHCSANKTSVSGPPSPGRTGGSSTVLLEAEGCFPEKPPRKKGTSLLKKMEQLRLRELTGLNSTRIPTQQVSDRPVLVQEEERVGCPSSLQIRSSSRTSSSPSSPHTVSSSSSNSQSESSSAVSTPSPVTRVRSNCKRSSSSVGVNSGTSRMCQNCAETEEDFRNQINNNNSFHESLVFQIPKGHKPGTFPTSLTHKYTVLSPIIDNTSVNWRTGSFHGYWGRRSCRRNKSSLAAGDQDLPCDVHRPLAPLDHRLSVYDNVPDDHQLSVSEGGSGESTSDVERMGEESDLSQLLEGQDVFSALDSILERISNLQQLVSSWSESLSEDNCSSSSSSSSSASQDSPGHSSSAASPCPSSPSHTYLEVQHSEEEVERSTKKATRSQRTRGSQQRHWCSEQSLSPQPTTPGVENQSVSQFMLLQKLALLKLTALMDKYSPSSKQGWNWAVPKLLRKTKLMEVKGRRVFGVPLLVSLQQTGEPLPPSILRALIHLRAKCLDQVRLDSWDQKSGREAKRMSSPCQVGLFRKSGVKSRIQYLRDLVESDPGGVSYEGHSAFDIADMVKQYFRDLPEPIFTSKLCETFLQIYQYFPKDQQLLAAQAAILLLPDENREALRALLFFLRDVVACVDENQMTPTNIAVCLAPSLFHLNTLKKDAKSPSRSSHRKYSLGRPDQKDLSENLAATQGLADMITEAQRLFQLPEFWPGPNLSSANLPEDPASEGPESMDQRQDQEEEQEQRRRKLQLSTQHLLMEAREKSRGWEGHPAPENVDLAFKKMDDSCLLWMWRGSVEVEATELELLHRLLRQPELWQRNLLQATIVQTLTKDTEVFRYLLQDQGQGLGARPPQDHLLLRTWQADPTCGPLYLSSVSTEHPEVLAEGVRAHVHSCLYVLEPTGTRKTRLTHICRTDTRGRSQEWHIRVSGHLLASDLLAIRDSFRSNHRGTS